MLVHIDLAVVSVLIKLKNQQYIEECLVQLFKTLTFKAVQCEFHTQLALDVIDIKISNKTATLADKVLVTKREHNQSTNQSINQSVSLCIY